MGKFYTASIENDTVYVTHLLANKNTLTLIECHTLSLGELTNFFNKKYPLFISVDLPLILSDQIEVPAVIKNKSVIKKYILHKISTNLKEQKPVFIYDKLSRQNDDSNIKYQVDAISEQSLMKTLSLFGNTDTIKSSTVDKYALCGIANSCIDKKSYICIYANSKMVTVLAISQKEALFSRSTLIESGSDESYKSDRDSFVNQTISYIRQQFRDTKFTNIALCGNLATDEDIVTQLNILYDLHISVLTPNIRNFPNEKIQTYIISVGAYFSSKKSQFMPDLLLANMQFRYVANALLLFSGVVLAVFLYLGYNTYQTHTNLLQRYYDIKSKLTFELSHTKTLPPDQLKISYDEMKAIEKYSNHTPVAALVKIKPLLEIFKPSAMKWKEQNGNVYLELFFIKHFTTLEAMYEFENSFDNALKKIKGNDGPTVKFLPNYATFTFKAIVVSKPLRQRALKGRRV